MKFNAAWVLHVLADTTRRMDKQKLWPTQRLAEPLRAHPQSCAILGDTHLRVGGGRGRERKLRANT